MEIYQVKSGDSLSAIARDVLGDIRRWPDIARLNNLAEPYTIFPGMQLIMPLDIPGPVVVPAGEVGPPAPRPAGELPTRLADMFGNITQTQWMYIAAAGLLVFVLMDRK